VGLASWQNADSLLFFFSLFYLSLSLFFKKNLGWWGERVGGGVERGG